MARQVTAEFNMSARITDSGLKIEDLEVGSGETASAGMTVTVDIGKR